MRVVDFFCGAGGTFGFQEKDIIAHFKDTDKVLNQESYNKIGSKSLPDSEIIIGCPPYQSPSYPSSRAASDDEYKKLINALLKIIAWKRYDRKKNKGIIKYWAIEIDPNFKDCIKKEYSWEELGLPGKGPSLKVKQRLILNVADFGAPQRRERLFCGDFPDLKEKKSIAEAISREDYNKEVIKEETEEGQYIVELSNQGEKRKHNPNFYNPQGASLPCVAHDEWNCDEKIEDKYLQCGRHKDLQYYPLHTRDWLGRIILPDKTRGDCLTWALPHRDISWLLARWIGKSEERGKKVDSFIEAIEDEFHKKIPDASTLQEAFMEGIQDETNPDDVVEKTKKLVNDYFPEDEFAGHLIDGSDVKFKKMIIGKVPLRVVAASMVLALACEESNRGDARGCRINGLKPRFANIFMPLIPYYFMRACWNRAEESEIKKAIGNVSKKG